jgi:hypothetical protein
MKVEHLNQAGIRMTFPGMSRDGVRKRLFRVLLRLLHIIPGKGVGMLARIPGVRKTYHSFFRFSLMK